MLPIVAETIEVGRRRIDTLVRVARLTETLPHEVEAAVTHRRVTIERVPIGRPVKAVPPVRQEGGTIVLPVIEEEVVVTRRLILREEIRVSQVEQTERHVETVQRRAQQVSVTRMRTGAEPTPEPINNPTHPRSAAMADETIVAVYDNDATAEAAIRDLRAAGIADAAITRHAASSSDYVAPDHDGPAYAGGVPRQEPGFWASLFGGEPDHDTAVYDRSVAGGATVVTVHPPVAELARVMDILERHSPIDLDERAGSYGLSPTTMAPALSEAERGTYGRAEAAADGSATVLPPNGTLHDESGVLQLKEEALSIGKRLVNQGGTRVRRFVRETPVEEKVTLREEKVTLERRPVTDGRPATDGDFTDRTIEMIESIEEPVVSKTARVVEEVALRKQATERVETVRDTVRREDVQVEQIPAGVARTANQAAVPATPKI